MDVTCSQPFLFLKADSHSFPHDTRGQAITLDLAFCLATFPLLLERTDTEKFGLYRIPEEDLSFPEAYARAQSEKDDEEVDLILDGVEEGDEEAGSSKYASENTPLLS